eukprot:scaffold1410_cov154-Amphora_coffeaeformis.AAC.2
MNVRSTSLVLRNIDIDDLHLLQRLVVVVRFDIFNQRAHIHASLDAAKHGMFAVQPRTGHSSDKELRAVRIGSSISHGQRKRSVVAQARHNLVGKFTSPYTLRAKQQKL